MFSYIDVTGNEDIRKVLMRCTCNQAIRSYFKICNTCKLDFVLKVVRAILPGLCSHVGLLIG